MRIKLIIIEMFCIILLTSVVNASSPYGKMDVFYNDELLPATEVAKPVIKIGEPFNVGINLTVYQKSEVSVELSEIGTGYFVILNGSTSKMNEYRSDIVEKDSSILYKWTVIPTEKWAGGSIPIDIVYQINDFETGSILINSGFTIAYPYISTDVYKDKIPVHKNQTIKEVESPTETKPPSTSTKVPAFTIASAVSVLALTFFLNRR
ncbi:MAG: sarcinarray family MAST domain-containing protein [Methanosarcina sp.]